MEIDIIDQDKMTGNVTNIFPRKNVLIRPPVANVDQAMILFAIVRPNPSYNLLDRFLIMMGQQKLPVIICFNKQDIATKQEQQMLSDAYEKCGYQVLFISVAKSRGIGALQEVLQGKTTVIAGPSGVGKSSLINALVGSKVSITADRPQTTRHRLLDAAELVFAQRGVSRVHALHGGDDELFDSVAVVARGREGACIGRGDACDRRDRGDLQPPAKAGHPS